MKLYWLPLLILTHLIALNSKAVAFEPKSVNQIQTEISEPATDGLDRLSIPKAWEDKWVASDDTSTALDKGFHRRRFGNSRFRSGRFREDIFFRTGRVHRNRFRQGEFRRDDIFFRHHNFREHNIYHERFNHSGFQRQHLHRDRFRQRNFYRIRIH